MGENGRCGENPKQTRRTKLKIIQDMNIQSLLDTGANVSVVVSVADLKEFAMSVFAEAMAARQEKKEETYLTPDEVAEKLGVSTNTLWRWNRDKYLMPIKMGRKSRYKLSDVEKLMEG